jgi:hypothetical protein
MFCHRHHTVTKFYKYNTRLQKSSSSRDKDWEGEMLTECQCARGIVKQLKTYGIKVDFDYTTGQIRGVSFTKGCCLVSIS